MIDHHSVSLLVATVPPVQRTIKQSKRDIQRRFDGPNSMLPSETELKMLCKGLPQYICSANRIEIETNSFLS